MVEQAISFGDLICEAFIDPLRSVLIIDDEYPTWEEVLNSALEPNAQDRDLQSHFDGKKWKKNPSELIHIVNNLRGKNPGLVIDIHDPMTPGIKNEKSAEESPTNLAKHLHQSDLLILDYNLEGNQGGLGGQKARDILRSVLTSPHFNLVIVHTGEHNLNNVMNECLISLLQSLTAQFNLNNNSSAHSVEDINKKIDEMITDETFSIDEFRKNFSLDNYLLIRKDCRAINEIIATYMNPQGQLKNLKNWAKETLGFENRELKSFFFWAIQKFERDLSIGLSNPTPDGLSWSINEHIKWLRTSSGFVVFVEKGDNDLFGNLQRALEDWKPTPSRLLLAKYRDALNRNGVKFEDISLRKNYVFAMFYKNICKPNVNGLQNTPIELLRKSKLKDHVSRQSEAISFLIEDEIIEFGMKIIAADEAIGNRFADSYRVNLNEPIDAEIAVNEFNCYVSTLPIKKSDRSGSFEEQLDSGHIFKINNEWWVCATPACDLQPGQNTIALKGNSQTLRPFTALRLDTIKTNTLTDRHVNSGSYCFVQHEGQIIGLSPLPPDEEDKPKSQKVRWRTFVAKDGGRIVDGYLKLIELKLDNDSVGQDDHCATVVAKLRYEYALNYIQKIGASVSRIGLGYEVYSADPS